MTTKSFLLIAATSGVIYYKIEHDTIKLERVFVRNVRSCHIEHETGGI